MSLTIINNACLHEPISYDVSIFSQRRKMHHQHRKWTCGLIISDALTANEYLRQSIHNSFAQKATKVRTVILRSVYVCSINLVFKCILASCPRSFQDNNTDCVTDNPSTMAVTLICSFSDGWWYNKLATLPYIRVVLYRSQIKATSGLHIMI